MKLTRLWQAIDEFAGTEASQIEWAGALEPHWALAAAFLKRTGRRAEDLSCPKSGESGCARQVVTLIDGRLRAECGDSSARCDHFPLSKDDVAILKLDVPKLAKALIRALQLVGPPRDFVNGDLIRIGRSEAAGLGILIFLAFPGYGPPTMMSFFDPVTSPPGPKLLLVPNPAAIDEALLSFLNARNVLTVALDDIVVWSPTHLLDPRLPAEELLQQLASAFAGQPSKETGSRFLHLPAGTRWRDVTIDFEEEELIRVRVPRYSRAATPADMGMAHATTGKATAQWAWLRQLALHNGRLPIGCSRAQKQKQITCGKLCQFWRLAENPIDDEDGFYVARFKITASGL